MRALLLAFTLATSLTAIADNPDQFFPLTEIEIQDGRDVIADTKGMVVYTFDLDEANISNCYAQCAKAWPPVTVKSADGIKSPMGVITRKTGELQLTLDAKPLYYFISDKKAGDTKGDGVGGVWHIIID